MTWNSCFESMQGRQIFIPCIRRTRSAAEYDGLEGHRSVHWALSKHYDHLCWNPMPSVGFLNDSSTTTIMKSFASLECYCLYFL